MAFNSIINNSGIAVRSLQVKKPVMVLLVILAIGLFLRIYISLFTDLPHIHRDTGDYLKQADALVNGGYINYFPNGYPLLIAFIKIIFGNNFEHILVWTNIILSAATIYFIYAISKKIF